MVVIRTSLFIDCSTGLDHKTEKAKWDMRYVCVFALKVDFLCSKSWYRARRDCKIINNVETVSSDKEKKKQYVGF